MLQTRQSMSAGPVGPRRLCSRALPALAAWLALVLARGAGTREECTGGHTCLEGSWEEEGRLGYVGFW